MRVKQCTLGGTFHGSNTVCSNGEPVVIPAASSWGLMALAVSVLIGGALILRQWRLAPR
jgi:hypothetical protein